MMRKALLAVLLALAALAPAALANKIGPRLGASIDPDQFVVGGQIVVEEVAPKLNFVPSLDLGIGDNLTTIMFNGDFNYMFRVSGSSWRPYAGGGVGVAFYSYDNDYGGGDDTEVGLNINAGAAVPTRSGNEFFLEAKIGIGDIPNLKFLAGWNFNM